MAYEVKAKVTSELLEQSPVNDEWVYKDLAISLIRKMPFEDLCRLIKFTKLDPNSQESERTLWRTDPRYHLEIEKILRLKHEGVILYTAKIDLP